MPLPTALLRLPLLLGFFALGLAAGVADESPPPESPAEILLRLEDQHGRRFDFRSGDRLIFVVGGKDVPTQTERWADELEAVLPASCRVVRLLDLQEVPRAGGPLVRRKIRRQIGDAPKRIFLDWDGLIARRFDVPVHIPVIIGLDENQTVLRVVEGDYSPRSRERFESDYSGAPSHSRRNTP